MDRFRLLVDSDEFMASFVSDLGEARQRVFTEVMTFEADTAGLRFAEALRSTRAPDVRLLVDSYIELMISDRLVGSRAGRKDPALQAESRATFDLLHRLASEGVATRIGNPLGRLNLALPSRNHKKLYLLDDEIVYLGGINVSDHNFEWHDIMLRIRDRDLAGFLAGDFESTWSGRPARGRFAVEGIEVHAFDGISNRRDFAAVLDLFERATETIWIESPYLTFPFYDRLRRAARRGVRVTLVAPGRNNKPLLDRYTRWETGRSGIELRLLDTAMTHVKACLIDSRHLLLGSCNFDYLSSTVQQEYVAVVTDPTVIRSFKDRVVTIDTKRSTAVAPRFEWSGRPIYWALQAAGRTAAAVCRLARN